MAANEDEKKALNRALGLINEAYRAEQNHFARRQAYRDMYHSYDPAIAKKKKWESKFVHPFPFFSQETKASFLYEGIYGINNEGLFQVSPLNLDMQGQAQLSERLLNYQESNSDFHKEFYEGAKGLGILGDWYLELLWDRKEEVYQQPSRGQITLDGQIERPLYGRYTTAKVTSVITKNQPEARTLNVNAVWPDPGAVNMESARYICVRDELPFDVLKEMEQYGRFINVDMLIGTSVPKRSSFLYDRRPDLPYSEGRDSKRQKAATINKENPMVEIVRIIYPATGEVETIGNGKVYMGRYIPHLNVKNTIEHIKNYSETDQWHGISDYESIYSHWKIVNEYQRMERDAVLLHHRGYFTVLADAGPAVKESLINLQPKSVITVNSQGAINYNKVEMFSPIAVQSKKDLVADAYQSLGLNEVLQGATPGSNIRSAQQMGQMANFGAKILSQSIRNIGFSLEKVGKKWLALNYEHLDADQLVPIAGINEIQEWAQVGPSDINPAARVRVRLSSEFEAIKEKKAELMLQSINAATPVPGFNVAKGYKNLFKFLNAFPDREEDYFLLDDETVAQLMMQNLMQGGQPRDPSQSGKTAVQ